MVSPASEYQTHAPTYNYAEMFPGWSPEAVAAGNYTADQPHYSSMAMEQYPYDASYQTAHHQYHQVGSNGYPYADYAPPTKSYSASAAASAATNNGGVVHTTRRKIIIRHLPSWATAHQVQDLIRHKSGISADKIQQIDLPLAAAAAAADGSNSNKTSTNRGYATITLETEDAASRAIRKLHGYKYDSRTPLAVEHTKEGVSDSEGAVGAGGGYYRPPTRTATRSHHSSTSSHHHHHRGDGGREREKRDSKREKEGSSSSSSHHHHHHSSSAATADNKKGSSSSKSHHHKSDVIIAHGSTRPPK